MSPISPEDRKRLLAMLEALVEDRTLLAEVSTERRIALLQAAGRVFSAHAFRAAAIHEGVSLDRAGSRKKHIDRDLRAATEIRTRASRAEVFEAPKRCSGIGSRRVGELTTHRAIATCAKPNFAACIHFTTRCARRARSSTTRSVFRPRRSPALALITGARIKIGYQAALMMLRAGARVIVTTRFPRDAAPAFRARSRFREWRDASQIHGLDLRHLPSVELFARYLKQTPIAARHPDQQRRADRAPPAGILRAHARARGAAARESAARARALLRDHEACKSALARRALRARTPSSSSVRHRRHRGAATIRQSGFLVAALSQIPYAYDETIARASCFPKAQLDADLQQVDLRAMNSWRMTLADVPTPEMLEVQLVNAVAPFILCSKLKALMMRDADRATSTSSTCRRWKGSSRATPRPTSTRTPTWPKPR